MRAEYKDFKKGEVTHYLVTQKDRPRDAPASNNAEMLATAML